MTWDQIRRARERRGMDATKLLWERTCPSCGLIIGRLVFSDEEITCRECKRLRAQLPQGSPIVEVEIADTGGKEA